MKEVKSPKKPLLYYYGIVLLIIIVFNVLVTPDAHKNNGQRSRLWNFYVEDRR